MKIFIVLILFGLLPSVSGAANLLSQSVGVAGDRVVTSREVQISLAIDSVLYPQSQEKTPKMREIQSNDPAMAGFVSSYLLDVAISQEAENLAMENLETINLQEAIQKIEKAGQGNAFWQKLGVGQAELKKIIQIKLNSRQFVTAKSGTLVGIISDQEAQAYYEKNRTKFGAMPFSSFKENIKSYLSREQLKERLGAWFEVIKKKYKIRNLLTSKEKVKAA